MPSARARTPSTRFRLLGRTDQVIDVGRFPHRRQYAEIRSTPHKPERSPPGTLRSFLFAACPDAGDRKATYGELALVLAGLPVLDTGDEGQFRGLCHLFSLPRAGLP